MHMNTESSYQRYVPGSQMIGKSHGSLGYQCEGKVAVGKGGAVPDDIDDEAVAAVQDPDAFGVELLVRAQDGDVAALPGGHVMAFACGVDAAREEVVENAAKDFHGEREQVASRADFGRRRNCV
ncbi:hypothetical protein MMC13_003629 [Lambiella insularis]|nr:hypothetical protein [Lambiella insularis]